MSDLLKLINLILKLKKEIRQLKRDIDSWKVSRQDCAKRASYLADELYKLKGRS